MKKSYGLFFVFAIFMLVLIGCNSYHIQSEPVERDGNNIVKELADIYDTHAHEEIDISYIITQHTLNLRPINVDILSNRSTHVIRGEIIDTREEIFYRPLPDWRAPTSVELAMADVPTTVYRIRVLEIFKGELTVDVIEVAYRGLLGDRRSVNADTGELILNFDPRFPLATNIEVILFLHCRTGLEYRPMHMSFACSINGIYWAAAQGSGDHVVLANYFPENPITLTMGDLALIKYEDGLGPRPENHRPPVGIDRFHINEDISMAEYYLEMYAALPGWDYVQHLLEEAIRVRDNPYSRQIHVNPISSRLRHEIMTLAGVTFRCPAPSHPSAITGPDTLELEAGYTATHVPGFRPMGFPHPTVTLSNNQGGRITWDSVVNRLYFAEGIAPGTHEIVLTASNSLGTDTHTFTLTVIGPATTPRPPATPRPSTSHPQEDDAGTESDSTSTPQPTTSPTPAPEDTTEAEAAPIVLLRFEIGSLYYTNHEGEVLLGDAAPFITGNRAHVPLRIIAEALGAEVTWNRATRTGYMAKGDTVISIVVNQPLPDGMGMPVIINNRTMVPARYISETFGAEVRWDRDNAAVYVYMPR